MVSNMGRKPFSLLPCAKKNIKIWIKMRWCYVYDSEKKLTVLSSEFAYRKESTNAVESQLKKKGLMNECKNK